MATITITYNRPAFGGFSVAPKHTYIFQCDCGDADTTGYKKDILKIARIHKNGFHNGNATIIDNARRA